MDEDGKTDLLSTKMAIFVDGSGFFCIFAAN